MKSFFFGGGGGRGMEVSQFYVFSHHSMGQDLLSPNTRQSHRHDAARNNNRLGRLQVVSFLRGQS